MLLLPAHHHYEQALNAHYAEQLGYAVVAAELSGAAMTRFLNHLPAMQAKLESAPRSNLDVVLDAIETELERSRSRGPS